MGGYSARYHAASLAAVFLALAIGILIGVGFGDDVVSGTTEDLEESLQNDVERQRERTDELAGAEPRARVQRGRVPGARRRWPARRAGRADRARRAAGRDRRRGRGGDRARRRPATQVAVVREPPDLTALADQLGDTRATRACAGTPTICRLRPRGGARARARRGSGAPGEGAAPDQVQRPPPRARRGRPHARRPRTSIPTTPRPTTRSRTACSTGSPARGDRRSAPSGRTPSAPRSSCSPPRPLHGRQRRPRRRPRRARLGAARCRRELRGQGQRRRAART